MPNCGIVDNHSTDDSSHAVADHKSADTEWSLEDIQTSDVD